MKRIMIFIAVVACLQSTAQKRPTRIVCQCPCHDGGIGFYHCWVDCCKWPNQPRSKVSNGITQPNSTELTIGPAPGFIIFNQKKEFEEHYMHDSLSSFQAYIRFQLAWSGSHGGELIGKVLASIPDTVFKIAWGKKTWDSLYNQ